MGEGSFELGMGSLGGVCQLRNEGSEGERHRRGAAHGDWSEAMVRSLNMTTEYSGEPSNWCGGLISRCNVEVDDPAEAAAVTQRGGSDPRLHWWGGKK